MCEMKNGQARQDEGRASDGRFTAGNKGGPGNPFARQTAAIRKAAADSATPEKMRALMDVLHTKAMDGDVAAARLWMQYSGGRPTPAADPDRLDAHELQVRREGVASVEDMKALFERMPASVMCEVARAVTPEVRKHMREAFDLGVRRQTETEERGREYETGRPAPYNATKADWAPRWLREGRDVSDEVTELLDACPAWMPDIRGHDRVGHRFGDALRRMREGLLHGVKLPGDDERCFVPLADWKRMREAEAAAQEMARLAEGQVDACLRDDADPD